MRTKVFWGLLLAIHLIAFFYQASQKRYLMVDSKEYVHASNNLVKHFQPYSDIYEHPLKPDHITKRPFVYPLLITPFLEFLGGFYGLALFQLGLSLFNVFLFIRIIRIFIPDWERYSLLFVCLLMFPAQFIYANLVMTEIWFQTLLMLATWMLLLGFQYKQAKFLFAYTFILCLGIFTKPVLYLFIFPHAILCAYIALKWRNIKIIAAALLPLLLVFIYVKSNEHATNYMHFSSIQNKSLLQYSVFHLVQRVEGVEAAHALIDSVEQKASKMNWAEGQEYMQKRGLQAIRSYPLTYLNLHSKGMLNFFLDPGRFDIYHFAGIDNGNSPGLSYHFSREGYKGIWNYLSTQPISILFFLLLVVCMNLGKLIGWIGMFFCWELDWTSKVLLSIFVIYIVGLTGINGASRFMLPVHLLVLMGLILWMEWKVLPFIEERFSRRKSNLVS